MESSACEEGVVGASSISSFHKGSGTAVLPVMSVCGDDCDIIPYHVDHALAVAL